MPHIRKMLENVGYSEVRPEDFHPLYYPFPGPGTLQQPPVQPVPRSTARDTVQHLQGGRRLSRPCLQCLQRRCDRAETVDKRPREVSLSQTRNIIVNIAGSLGYIVTF